jgi:hypothetical protein
VAAHSEYCWPRLNTLRRGGAAFRALLAETKHFTKRRRSIESIAGQDLLSNGAALRALLVESYEVMAQH